MIVEPKGWSFEDLNNKDRSRNIMDPITVLARAALFPCYEEGTKVALYGRHLSCQEPSKYTWDFYYFKLDLLGFKRGSYSEDHNNLEVFQINTLNATEYFDPIHNESIKNLFKLAREGLQYTTKAYEGDPEKNIKRKASPIAAVKEYTRTLDDAIEGKLQFNTKFSEAEMAIKNMWDIKEIDLMNRNIADIIELKGKGKPVTQEIQLIKNKLAEKEKEFVEICNKVSAGILKIDKVISRPQAPAPVKGK